MASSRDQVFVSYSHKDAKWLDDLLTHLKPYLREGTVTAWSDKQIQPGSKWFNEINVALKKAKVAVLLVSPNFLASDFIHDHELTPLLADASDVGVSILWIPVRASSYEKSPIREFQAVIAPDKPLAAMKAERDSAWVLICEEIERSLRSSTEGTQQSDSVSPLAGQIVPVIGVVGADSKPPPHRPLLRDLERAISGGTLRDSLLAEMVLTVLASEKNLEMLRDYDPDWITTAIRLSDEYFVMVRESAGERDWQRDFAAVASPILVGVGRSLKRSPDAQAVVKQLCDSLAKRLRVRLEWPVDSDRFNDATNDIYKACLEATELESDQVLISLKALTVVGPA